jgi:exopolysaccharide production protein ExoZ
LALGYGLVLLAIASYGALNQGLDVTYFDWRVLYWGLPAILLIAGVVVIEQQTPVRHLAGPHLLGDASFAIYLSHPFTLGVIGWVWSTLALETETALSSTAFIVIAMVISAAAGILLHLVCEKPIIQGLRNWTLSRNSVRVASHGG